MSRAHRQTNAYDRVRNMRMPMDCSISLHHSGCVIGFHCLVSICISHVWFVVINAYSI